MEIKPIKTKADYRAELREVEELMAARQGTRDGERLDVLVTLIESYERKHFPMELPDLIEAIGFSPVTRYGRSPVMAMPVMVEDRYPLVGIPLRGVTTVTAPA